jgi:hypothetical protein
VRALGAHAVARYRRRYTAIQKLSAVTLLALFCAGKQNFAALHTPVSIAGGYPEGFSR